MTGSGWMTRFQFPGGAEIFLSATAVSRSTQEPIQPPEKWVLGAISPGVKQLKCEAYYCHLLQRLE
jgi:hypothetical protein